MPTTPTVPESRVEAALLAGVQAVATALGLPVQWGNLLFPSGGAALPAEYLAVGLTPGANERVSIKLSEEHVMRGVLGVSVMTQLGSGGTRGVELGGRIADHFVAQEKFSSGSTVVRVTARPSVVGGYRDGDRWRTPVTVEYETISV